jgi:L-ascorbate metabolism protein UlaG (beta-lactamase superfamily)
MIVVIAATSAGVIGVGLLVGCRVFSAPPYRGPASGAFDGERFHNALAVPGHGLGSFWKWQRTRRPGPWRRIDAEPGPAPPRRVDGGAMRVTYVNHATVLVQMDGLNVLTDPIWSERCSPVSWAGPRRMRPPGIRFEDLPPIDLVLVSHNHYDHLDLSTLRRLSARKPRILVGLGNRALLAGEGIASNELDWGQEATVGPLRVTAVPARHFSGRGLCDRNRTLWTGFVVQGPSGAVYFAGDTGFGPHFADIGRRFGPLRLALLPIGAFLPSWFMSPIHISPDEALRAHGDLRASTSVAIHFGTFPLGDDGQDEAPKRLTRAIEAARPVPRFWILGFGEGRDVPPASE